MGTVVSFHVEPGECPAVEAHAAVAAACTRLHELDDIFSTWKPGSPINRFRAGILRLRRSSARDGSRRRAVRRGAGALAGLVRSLGDAWRFRSDRPGQGLGHRAGARGSSQLAGVEAAMVNGGGDIAVLRLAQELRGRGG